MKNIGVYGEISQWMAADFNDRLNDAERFGEDIRIRISTSGGEVNQGYSMLCRLQDFTGNKSIVVDGKAFSMGAIMCLYSDDVEAFDVSQFMFHRAGYPEWFENSEYFTDDLRKSLDDMNKIIKEKMKSKLNEESFEKVTGKKIDDLFTPERPEVWLNAKEAKRIGLIKNIRTLDQVAKAEITAFCDANNLKAELPQVSNNLKPDKMTIEEVKKHPEVIAQLKAEFQAEIKDNISAWLEFKDVDAETVLNGVASLDAPNQAAMAKFQRKMMEANASKQDGVAGSVPEPVGENSPAPEAAAEENKEPSLKEKLAEYSKNKNL